MNARERSYPPEFFPLRYWWQVAPHAVQAQLRGVLGRWGLPKRIRVDNGPPWGSWADLPPGLSLWLIGLGVQVVWNHACRPQENGMVERAQGTTKRWAEPQACAGAKQLQARLDWACCVQREQYPACEGKSRTQAYPALLAGGRAYGEQAEAETWDIRRVHAFLVGLRLRRVVDKVGRVSLYNRAYSVGRCFAGQEVYVRFAAEPAEWVFLNARGEAIVRHAAEQISREQIVGLNVMHRKSRGKPTQGQDFVPP